MDRFIVFNVVIIKLSFLYLKSNMDRFIDIIKIPLFDNMIFKIQYGQIYRNSPTPYGLYGRIFKIQYGQIYRFNVIFKQPPNLNLKSNMDRFIAQGYQSFEYKILNLKSNMDRFIEFQNHKEKVPLRDLKSNMDRFIGCYRH